MNGENVSWKKMAVTYFKILSRDYIAEIKGNYEKPYDRTR
jgi:hypothetical protein